MAGDCLCACYVCLFLRLISEVGPAARVWEVRSEWSKYELVLWILVNYHGLFAPDNDRPGLAKTASLYVRRKWALPQTLSANRRKHRTSDEMGNYLTQQSHLPSRSLRSGQMSHDGGKILFIPTLDNHLLSPFVSSSPTAKCNVGIPQKLHGVEKMITVFCWIKLPAMKRWWGRQGRHNKCYMASDPKYTQILILILVTITDILHPEHQS